MLDFPSLPRWRDRGRVYLHVRFEGNREGSKGLSKSVDESWIIKRGRSS